MHLQFSWSRTGMLLVDVPEADLILASFLGGDVDGRPDEAHRVRTGIEAAVLRGATRADEDLGGEGYAVTVCGSEVTLESNYDLFPTATYPATTVLSALAQLEAWLLVHLPDRPQ